MFSKLAVLIAVLVSISAQDQQHGLHGLHPYASSSYNDNRIPVQYIQVAPAITRYPASSAPIYHRDPVQAKIAVRTLANYAAPSYYHSPAPAYAPPVANYAANYASAAAGPAGPVVHKQEEFAHPKYEYAYAIEDHHTGDLHSHQEQRDGDHVVGQYTLHEADGTIRIVRYYDDGHGFNAVVERQGTPTEAPAALKHVVAVPVAIAAHNH